MSFPVQVSVVKSEPKDEDSDDDNGRPSAPITSTKPPRYEVASVYQHAWDTASEKYSNQIMEVYGSDELPVDYNRFQKVLAPGTTVAVTFVLVHYAIRDRETNEPASDTYSALIRTVSVLKDAEKPSRPSFTPKRRPLPVPQVPSRGTLKLSADTFSPVRGSETDSSPTKVRSSSIKRLHKESRESSPSILPARGRSAESFSTTSQTSEDVLDKAYPLLLKEMKNPGSRFFIPALLPSLNRQSSPSVGSSSTASSGSNIQTQDGNVNLSSWVEVGQINSVSEPASGENNTSDNNEDPDPSVLDGAQAPSSESTLSVLSSSEDENAESKEDSTVSDKGKSFVFFF